jgi:hypothetical protein
MGGRLRPESVDGMERNMQKLFNRQNGKFLLSGSGKV